MNERFQQLVRFVASEDRPGDRGLEISNKTRQAYEEMLAMYDAVIPEEDMDDSRSLREVRSYIGDVPRTVYMLRAMLRAVLAQSFRRDVVKVVEAGCGTGLLATAAAALDDGVEVQAYDISESHVLATARFKDAMGCGDRVKVTKQNLLSAEFTREPVDVLVAEHLSSGLRTEYATQLPRKFKVDPDFVIPFSARPVVFSGLELRIDRDFEGSSHLFVPRRGSSPILHRGEEIVLGDPSSPEVVDVHVSTELFPGKEPVVVGCEVRWASPRFTGSTLYQPQMAKPVYDTRCFQNHLLHPSVLGGSYASTFEDLMKDPGLRYAVLHNKRHARLHTEFDVNYSIGFGRRYASPDEKAPVTVISPSDVELLSLSQDRFGFEGLPKTSPSEPS